MFQSRYGKIARIFLLRLIFSRLSKFLENQVLAFDSLLCISSFYLKVTPIALRSYGFFFANKVFGYADFRKAPSALHFSPSFAFVALRYDNHSQSIVLAQKVSRTFYAQNQVKPLHNSYKILIFRSFFPLDSKFWWFHD